MRIELLSLEIYFYTADAFLTILIKYPDIPKTATSSFGLEIGKINMYLAVAPFFKCLLASTIDDIILFVDFVCVGVLCIMYNV